MFPSLTDLLEEGGELLCHVAFGSFVPESDLFDGVLQELGHLQFDPQLLFQPLLLKKQFSLQIQCWCKSAFFILPVTQQSKYISRYILVVLSGDMRHCKMLF